MASEWWANGLVLVRTTLRGGVGYVAELAHVVWGVLNTPKNVASDVRRKCTVLVVDMCAHAFLLGVGVRALERSKRAFVACLWWPRVRRRACGVVIEPPAVVGLQVDGRPRHEQHQGPPLWHWSMCMCGEKRS